MACWKLYWSMSGTQVTGVARHVGESQTVSLEHATSVSPVACVYWSVSRKMAEFAVVMDEQGMMTDCGSCASTCQ